MTRKFITFLALGFIGLFSVMFVLIGVAMTASSNSADTKTVAEVLRQASDREACVNSLTTKSDDHVREAIVAAIGRDVATLNRIAAEIEADGTLKKQIKDKCPVITQEEE